jgi:adenylate cyclase
MNKAGGLGSVVDWRGAGMRLLRVISYGTKGYPENVARRLRAMNIAAWITAALMASFAIRRLIDPPDDKLRPGLVSAAAALCFAALPLLHRFSPLAAPLVFVGFA